MTVPLDWLVITIIILILFVIIGAVIAGTTGDKILRLQLKIFAMDDEITQLKEEVKALSEEKEDDDAERDYWIDSLGV